MPRTRRTSPKGKTQRFSPRPGAHSPVLVEDHHVEPLVRVHRSLRWTRWPRRGEVLSRTLRDDLSDLKKKNGNSIYKKLFLEIHLFKALLEHIHIPLNEPHRIG